MSIRPLAILVAFAAMASAEEHPLIVAAKNQDLDAIRALITRHVDTNKKQGDGATALHWAAHWNHLKMADLLVTAGADVNAADDTGVTPLSLACWNGSAAMVEKFLRSPRR